MAINGEGARLYGGRWNNRGRLCVYLASSESLAILEVYGSPRR
ncbi:RES domain-containing protein, partial [Candidatus Regiella insecticola]